MIACPECNVFDSREYFKPMLMPYEVELAFNHARDFSLHYAVDYRQILPGGLNYVQLETSSNSDISLISGDVRNLSTNDVPIDKTESLAFKSDGTVGTSGVNYYLQRSWKGLEQRLGMDEIAPVENGRTGLPMAYNNEPV